MFCFLDSKTDLAGVSSAQFMFTLQMNLHVVALVRYMVAELAGKFAVHSPFRIGPHDIWQTVESVAYLAKRRV